MRRIVPVRLLCDARRRARRPWPRLAALATIAALAAGAGSSADAQDPEGTFRAFPAPAAASPPELLVIYGTTDMAAAIPPILGFQERNPLIEVHYHDLQSLTVYERVVRETDEDEATADLVWSSAMDLQFRLANDGYAQPWSSPALRALPSWANWRNEVYGITLEPAVFVYHRPAFADRDVPTTRGELRRLLQQADGNLYGRIATYDIERSGLGLLYLARDLEHSDDIWALVSLFGEQGVRLFTSSAAMIDRVGSGRLHFGYNILGSYAQRMALDRPDLGVLLPQDYTVLLSRVALLPRAARSADLGGRFLDFLVSPEGQTLLAEEAGLLPVLRGTSGAWRDQLGARARPVPLGPGLLAYLDQTTRTRLIERWNAALVGRPDG